MSSHHYQSQVTTMQNMAASKPSKWFSNKSFKLSLPLLCRGHDADVSSPTTVQSPSPSPSPSPSSSSSRSKSRVQELREVFRHFDGDGDGKISSEGLRAFFVSIGENMSFEEAESAITDLDSDGDGLLDFDDFLKMMEGEGVDEDLRKAFEMFEVVKGSGRITPRGLQRTLSRLGDEKSFEECEAMIRGYDLDGNGELDFDEFNRMMG